MQQVAVMIGEDLDFQVACARQIFFQKDRSIAERGTRFSLRFFEKRIKLRRIMNDAHAAATASHRRFHNDRIADFPRDFLRFLRRVDRILRSGQNGNPSGCGKSSSGSLVSQEFEKIRWWANECDPAFFASAGQRRILRKKAVARVDCVDALLLR